MNRDTHNINYSSTIFIKYTFFLVLLVVASFYFLSISNKVFAADTNTNTNTNTNTETNTELPDGVSQSDLVNVTLTDEERASFLKYLEENKPFENPEVSNGVSCFDYYKFQSVQVSVGTDRDVYLPGNTIQFTGELQNENKYPVVDGYVFVRISKEADDYITDGHDVVDEFFGAEKVSIDAIASKDVDFVWEIPESIQGGKYRADYFFSVGKKFNLGGLPFSNEVIIGNANFEIVSSQNGISFDRKSTKVNGAKYQHIGNWPSVIPDSSVIITQDILNTSTETISADITYELYKWDGLNEEDKLDLKTEQIEVSPESSSNLSYTIDSVSESVYYLKITVLSGDGQKSIVNIRISSDLAWARLNYPAITKFPLRKGDNVVLFSCFHNTSNFNAEGSVLVTLYDKSDKKIDSVEYIGVISSAMMAMKKDLTVNRDYDFVKIVAQVFDSNNSEVDHYESIYNCENIDKNKCQQPYNLLLILIVFLVAIAGVMFFIIKSNKIKKNEHI